MVFGRPVPEMRIQSHGNVGAPGVVLINKDICFHVLVRTWIAAFDLVHELHSVIQISRNSRNLFFFVFSAVSKIEGP